MNETIANPELRIDVSLENLSEINCDLSGEVNPLNGGTNNYELLENLPNINGTKLIGNYDEIDPTVPEWAKNNVKPKYTPDEIGAIDIRNEISFTDIKSIWDNVFGKED